MIRVYFCTPERAQRLAADTPDRYNETGFCHPRYGANCAYREREYWVIAKDGDRVVGTLFVNVRGRVHRQIRSQGTWVHRSVRRQGVATRMWRRMIREIRPELVFVNAVTDRGFTLGSSIRRRYPRIKVVVWDSGMRPLRRLRK